MSKHEAESDSKLIGVSAVAVTEFDYRIVYFVAVFSTISEYAYCKTCDSVFDRKTRNFRAQYLQGKKIETTYLNKGDNFYDVGIAG